MLSGFVLRLFFFLASQPSQINTECTHFFYCKIFNILFTFLFYEGEGIKKPCGCMEKMVCKYPVIYMKRKIGI